MKNNFSLFEKICMTLGVINAILFMVGIFIGCTGNEDLGIIFFIPFLIQALITLLLIIFVEIVICRIWGCDIHIFPSIFKE